LIEEQEPGYKGGELLARKTTLRQEVKTSGGLTMPGMRGNGGGVLKTKKREKKVT